MFRTGLEKSLKICHNPGKVYEDFALYFYQQSSINYKNKKPRTLPLRECNGDFDDFIVSLKMLVR